MSKAIDFSAAKGSNIIFLTGDWSFAAKLGLKKNDALNYIYTEIIEQTEAQTVVFPTATMNLCNTTIPYDLLRTPSNGMGAMSEYLRKQSGAFRSNHPFWSTAAIGKYAEEIVANVSRHAFGAESVWDRLCSMQAVQITVGKPLGFALTTIHHCEAISCVPYRYTKEFLHPVITDDGSVSNYLAYMSVMYRDIGLKKKILRNRAFLDSLNKESLIEGSYSFRDVEIPLSVLRMSDFRSNACKLLAADPFLYLEDKPSGSSLPYQI